MPARPLTEIMDAGWAAAMEPVAPQIAEIGERLRGELDQGRTYLPAADHVLRAFTYPLADVRVLIVGQDPYPTPGHPIGLSFSVAPDVRPLPPSLRNMFTELADDLGAPPPSNGDLTPWAERGVMLLNRVLTVRPGAAASHRRWGWEAVTEHAIKVLVERDAPLVAILWGKDAGTLRPMLGDTPVVASPHPSPLSAYRGFFGSRPYSRTNELLLAAGAEPVDWRLP
ncbi:uracil-DNA glycosylase [Georgenia sp. Z1491]|uniref:uracil-DNA glycosylase n=1 Tax=Georgenia sp. Z1491 TaxID=3416707 RepID=UPI003CF43CE9